MPPIQWVNERQKRPDRERPSTLFRIEAPVVVKPETVSKKASIKRGMSPPSTKGSEPSSDMASQASPTAAKPSRAKISRVRGRTRRKRQPRIAVSASVTAKGRMFSR